MPNTLEQIDNVTGVEKKLDDAKKKQTALKRQLEESEAKLMAMKAGYETAVRNGEAEAQLDAMDQELFKSDRERTRISIRLQQCDGAIEELFRARDVAQRTAEDDENRVNEQRALEEAAELELLVQQLTQKAGVHWRRIERIRAHAAARGVLQNPFKLSNLERRITAIFRGGSVNRGFEQPYHEILAGNIMTVARQIDKPGEIEQAEPQPTIN